MSVKISLLGCFLFVTAIATVLIGCNQDDGGSADDSADDDDWNTSDDGCEYIINGAEEQSYRLSNGQNSGEGNDCVPGDLPENVDPEPLFAILDAFLGTYVDQNDAQITITCRPGGVWLLPNIDYPPGALCDLFWEIPVWITFDEKGATVLGNVNQSYLKELAELEPSSWPMADMYFAKDEIEYRANRQLGVSDIVWIFEMPEGWGVWTKVD